MVIENVLTAVNMNTW